jgi:uncharacterized phage-associated protein
MCRTKGLIMIRDPHEPQLDYGRLLDVVHYICSKCEPSELGNVKLHKILYFADMLHFADTGRALTGVEYLKQKYGPCARHLTKAICHLRDEGRLRVERRDFHGFKKMDYIALGEVRLSRLDNEKIVALLDAVMEFVCKHSANEISELSHNAAWEVAQVGQPIPYYTAFWLQPPEVTEDDVAEAAGRLKRLPEFA